MAIGQTRAGSVVPFIADAVRRSQRPLTGGTLEAEIIEGLRLARERQGRRYREVQADLRAFEGDAFGDHMRLLVNALYTRKAIRWNKDYAYHRYLPVVAMMTRTLAVMAHQTPEAFLVDASGQRLAPDHPESLLWAADARSIRWASIIKTIDRETVLYRTLLVQPAWVKGSMRWLRHAPDHVHVIQDLDDPSDLADAPLVSLSLAQPVDSQRTPPPLYASWTTDDTGRRHFVHDENGALYANGLTDDDANPYGINPFAIWRDGEPAQGEFFLPPRESWWTEQRWINRTMMTLAHVVDFQSFAVPLLKNWSGEDPEPTLSPDEPIMTTNDRADFSFVTPNTNLDQLEDVVENALRRSAVAEGMPPDLWSIDLAARSMAALKLGRQHLNERREAHAADYSYYIERTWDAHRAVANYHRPRQRYSADVRLHVEWRPIPMPVDRFQEAQARSVDYAAGVSNPIDDIMTRDRVDRDEATDRHRRNVLINAGGSETDQVVEVRADDVLKGAQLKAASDIVTAVAAGAIPRDAGLGQLFILFNLTSEQAEIIMGSAGTGEFTPPTGPVAPSQPRPSREPMAAAVAGDGVRRPPGNSAD